MRSRRGALWQIESACGASLLWELEGQVKLILRLSRVLEAFGLRTKSRERRAGIDRRSGADRRAGTERRVRDDGPPGEERMSGTDRRSGTGKRSGAERRQRAG